MKTADYFIENFQTKGVISSLAKNPLAKNEIIGKSKFLDDFGFIDIPLKIRCLVLHEKLTQETYPRCPACEKPVGWAKAYADSLMKHCSNRCSLD